MITECSLTVQELAQTLCNENAMHGKTCLPNPIVLSKAIQHALVVEPWRPFDFIHSFTINGELVPKGLKISIETSDKTRSILDYRVGASGNEEGVFECATGTERKMLFFGQQRKDGQMKEGYWTYSLIGGKPWVTHFNATGYGADADQTAKYERALKQRPSY